MHTDPQRSKHPRPWRSPFIAFLALAAITWSQAESLATTYTVCDNGCNYSSIDQALEEAAGAGVTIKVQAGTYREKVVVDSIFGTQPSPAIILAEGEVVLDGTDDFTDENDWLETTKDSVFIAGADLVVPDCQVFVDDVRYAYVTSAFSTLKEGEYTFDDDKDSVYVHVVGGANPGLHDTWIGNRSRFDGFEIRESHHLIIDGFIVRRMRGQGVDVRGDATTQRAGIIVRNCTTYQNFKQGIALVYVDSSAIYNNTSYDNIHYGIYAHFMNDSRITHNVSHSNLGEGRTGIKLGDSMVRYQSNRDTVAYNTTYSNQDTGIEVRASDTIVHHNISYDNRDHGYDFLYAEGIVLANNISAHNYHDGVSVEKTAEDIKMYNNILYYNALQTDDPDTVTVNQLFVDDSTTAEGNTTVNAFHQERNIIVGDTSNPGPWDRYLIKWFKPSEDGTEKNNSLRQFASESVTDSFSKQVDPLFEDADEADFRILDPDSKAIDFGSTNFSEWVNVDWRGFVAHDVAAVTDSGLGSTKYADVGVYEYDPVPGAVDSLTVDEVWSSDIDLSWKESADDLVDTTGTAGYHQVRFSTASIDSNNWFSASITDATPPDPDEPLEWQSFNAWEFEPSTTYYIAVRRWDGNQWGPVSDNVTATTLSCCQTGWSMKPASQRPGGATDSGARPTAIPTTEAVVLEMTADGLGRDWSAYATQASDWISAETGDPPFILFQQPDGSGGWRTRVQHEYRSGPVGILPQYGEQGRVVIVGPRGQERFTSGLGGRGGGTLTFQSANHSRLGDISEDATGGDADLNLSVGDTITVSYSGSSESTEGSAAYFFVTGGTDDASPASLKGLGEVPRVFALSQNHPNPFSTTTTLRFDLPRAVDVRLDVFDVLGRRVVRLANGSFEPGYHSIVWDRRGRSGQRVPAGVYLYRIQAGSFRAEKKMVLMP